jgi:hypothetical protein
MKDSKRILEIESENLFGIMERDDPADELVKAALKH